MSQQLAPPSNALALAGFVLGAAGVLLVFVPGAWALPLLPALLAVIFGFVGITTANRLAGRRKVMAVWAVILGVVGFVLPWIVALVFNVTV